MPVGLGGSGGLIGGVGGLIGGMTASNMLGRGMRQAEGSFGEGVDYLKQGNVQQRADFQPYMGAGQRGIAATENLLGQGVGQAQPKLAAPFQFDVFKDPSAQYRMDQANAAINASALAKGSVGGGLANALQANSQNMAQQAHQQAFANYLSQNQQDFGQQQQIYNNAADVWRQRLAGAQNLMGTGLQAAGQTGQLGLGYGQGVNQNLMNQAQMQYENAQNRAGAVSGALDSAFSGLSSLF